MAIERTEDQRKQLVDLESRDLANYALELRNLTRLIEAGDLEAAKKFVFGRIREDWMRLSENHTHLRNAVLQKYPHFSKYRDMTEYRLENGISGLERIALTGNEKVELAAFSRYAQSSTYADVICPNTILYLNMLEEKKWDVMMAQELASAARQARWLKAHHTSMSDNFVHDEPEEQTKVREYNKQFAEQAAGTAAFFVSAVRIFAPEFAEGLLFLDVNPSGPFNSADDEDDENLGSSYNPMGLLPNNNFQLYRSRILPNSD